MAIRFFCAIIFFIAAAPAMAQVHDPRALNADPATATGPLAPRLTGLGEYHFAVTTSNQQSQYFFNQGFRLNTAFNHSEALRSFKEAVRLDPENAMAYWGWALVLGPNLNLPMQDSVKAQAYGAIQNAVRLKNQVSARERAYIEALATRYSNDPTADRAALDASYADAMAALVAMYPDDLDAATLYAAAIMNTNPWDYWYKDGTPKPHTEVVLETLQSVLDRNPNHAGALHYWIHTVEAFRPELGVAAADALRGLMPGAGHLVHMPSHIYMRVGRYADSFRVNVAAAAADEGYITQCQAEGIYPLVYFPHNLHFMVWSAMFLGQQDAALEAARKVAAAIPEASTDNRLPWYESFRSQPMFVMVRFGMWEAILNEPKPAADAPFMTGIWHYSRGMAFTHQGDLQEARQELISLADLMRSTSADPSYLSGFAEVSRLLIIAQEVLMGEIAAADGDYGRAIAHLGRAVRLEDGLLYSEPPDWYFPVRHILGAVLLEAELPAEAEVVYWEDLRRNPENGYALFGLKQSLQAQGNMNTAAAIDARLDAAWADADHALTSSRY